MSATVASKRQAKIAYSSPSLTVYGPATKLTAAGTGQQAEGQGGSATDPLRRD